MINKKAKLPPEFKDAIKDMQQILQDYKDFEAAMAHRINDLEKIQVDGIREHPSLGLTSEQHLERARLKVEAIELRSKIRYKEAALKAYKEKLAHDAYED